MRYQLIFVLVLVGLLTACGGAAEPSTSSQAAAAVVAEEIELGPAVDVHTTASVQDRNDVVLIDVREQWEYDQGHIPGITLIPMSEISNRLEEIPTDKEVIVTCRSGNRSGQVTDYLRQSGFDNVHNMQGGIVAWQEAGYEVEQ
jgi:rhodanese-related sulfurtransferase